MFRRRSRTPDVDPVRRAAQYRVDREIAREEAERQDAERGDGPDASRADLPGVGDEARADGRRSDEREPDEGEPDEGDALRGPRRVRQEDRAMYVDTAIDQAIRRGEFDDLPLAGKPIPGLTGTHDPDWWLKSVIERERLTGLGPPAMLLKQEDRELDDRLDRELDEQAVREILADFNARVVDARRQLLGGPPVVTPTRDVEREVARWRARRAAR